MKLLNSSIVGHQLVKVYGPVFWGFFGFFSLSGPAVHRPAPKVSLAQSPTAKEGMAAMAAMTDHDLGFISRRVFLGLGQTSKAAAQFSGNAPCM